MPLFLSRPSTHSESAYSYCIYISASLLLVIYHENWIKWLVLWKCVRQYNARISIPFISSSGDIVSTSCGPRRHKCVMILIADAAPVKAALAAPSLQGWCLPIGPHNWALPDVGLVAVTIFIVCIQQICAITHPDWLIWKLNLSYPGCLICHWLKLSQGYIFITIFII